MDKAESEIGVDARALPGDLIAAEILPASAPARRLREPGALRGQIQMSDDFDTWPIDILDAIES